MSKFLKRMKVPFLNIAYAIRSLGWKRDSSVIMVGSWFGEKFADNSRFIFQYLADNKTKLGIRRVVWVSRSEAVVNQLRAMGYEAFLMNSKESIEVHKEAKYHLICNSSDYLASVQRDILTEYSWGAYKINLWHGAIGFKGVGLASQGYINKKLKHPVVCGIYEYVHKSVLFRKYVDNLGGWGNCIYLSTSLFKTSVMQAFFQLPKTNFIETGFPRVSGSVKLLPEEEYLINKMKDYDATVIYLPTFRGEDSSFDFNDISRGIKDYIEEKNILWIQKLHSASTQKNSNFAETGNIVNLPHDFDINAIIPLISVMVTDYSSAGGDAMYYFKPVLFYVPDFDEYRKGDRGFLIEPDEIMCGPRTQTISEFRQSLDEVINGIFVPDEKYISVRNKYFEHDATLEEIWNDIVTRVERRD